MTLKPSSILSSMFTAIVVTRLLLEWWIDHDPDRSRQIFRGQGGCGIMDLMKYKWFYIGGFLAIMLLCGH